MPKRPGRPFFTPETLGWKPASSPIPRPRLGPPPFGDRGEGPDPGSDPQPASVSAEEYRELAFRVLITINAGLVERLIRNPQTNCAGEWLKERFVNKRWFRHQARQLAEVLRLYKNGEKIVDDYLLGLTNQIATERPPRKNAATCNWVALYFQSERAAQAWLEEESLLARHWKNPTAKAMAYREAGKHWVQELYAAFDREPDRCPCGGRNDPPTDLNAWLDELARKPEDRKEVKGPSDLIERVVAHYHNALSPTQLRRLLDHRGRRTKSIRSGCS